MDRFTEVNKLVKEAIQVSSAYCDLDSHAHAVADRITHEIIGLFDQPFVAPQALEYDLVDDRQVACS